MLTAHVRVSKGGMPLWSPKAKKANNPLSEGKKISLQIKQVYVKNFATNVNNYLMKSNLGRKIWKLQ